MMRPLATTILALLLAGQCLCQTAWRQRYPAASPTARSDHAMVYDRARNVMVMWGGKVDTSSNFPPETWEWAWDRAQSQWAWRKLAAAGPKPRTGHDMAYDERRQRVVMFGGSSGSGSASDTWEFDGSSWVQRATAVGPSARWLHAMAYDAARGEVLLFSGGNGSSDTWTWDGTAWNLRNPPTSPPARQSHGMAYDRTRQVVVLFGGINYADTWEWDGTTWTQHFPPNSPPYGPAEMAYDGVRDRMVLWSGGSAFAWEWDGVTWQIMLTASPATRVHGAMAFNAASGRTVLFGGGNSWAGKLADTWEYFAPLSASYTSFASGCPGTAGTAILAPVSGELPWFSEGAFTLQLSPLPMASPAVWGILGASNSQWAGTNLPLSLGGLGMPGCALAVSIDLTVPLLPQAGAASWTIPFPNDPTLVGQTLFTQAIVADAGANPTGTVLSDASTMVIGTR